MWTEKLTFGVLRVLTPLGPRYVKPSWLQRIYLLWLFRNFRTLPLSVLSLYQKKRIDQMCTKHGFLSQPGPSAAADFAVLGTLEQRPPAEQSALASRLSAKVRHPVAPFATDAQRQS